MCAKECMLSKNVQGFCFFPVFSKAIHKTNYNLKSLKIPQSDWARVKLFETVILLIVTEMTLAAGLRPGPGTTEIRNCVVPTLSLVSAAGE